MTGSAGRSKRDLVGDQTQAPLPVGYSIAMSSTGAWS
jgi:hypothetical protein